MIKDKKMIRVIVEDCVKKVPNRFELVLIAVQRSRELTAGAPSKIGNSSNRKDRTAVIALREIAEGVLDVEEEKDTFISRFQKSRDDDEIEVTEVKVAEKEWDEATTKPIEDGVEKETKEPAPTKEE